MGSFTGEIQSAKTVKSIYMPGEPLTLVLDGHAIYHSTDTGDLWETRWEVHNESGQLIQEMSHKHYIAPWSAFDEAYDHVELYVGITPAYSKNLRIIYKARQGVFWGPLLFLDDKWIPINIYYTPPPAPIPPPPEPEPGPEPSPYVPDPPPSPTPSPTPPPTWPDLPDIPDIPGTEQDTLIWLVVGILAIVGVVLIVRSRKG